MDLSPQSVPTVWQWSIDGRDRASAATVIAVGPSWSVRQIKGRMVIDIADQPSLDGPFRRAQTSWGTLFTISVASGTAQILSEHARCRDAAGRSYSRQSTLRMPDGQVFVGCGNGE